MVLLHASPSSHAHWLFQMYYFSRWFKLYNFDVRGHGLSTRTLPKGGISIKDLSEDLKIALTRLGISRPIIMGLSLGSIIAQQFASDYPDRAKALVLAGTAVYLRTPPLQEMYKARLAALRSKDRPIEKYLDAFFSTPLGKKDATMLGDEFRKSRLGKYLVELLKQRAIEELEPETHIAFNEVFRRLDMRDVVSKIRVPTLVISGEEESVELVKEAHGLIKGSGFKVVSAAGHYSCMENPQEFNLYVDEFLESIKSKPR